MVTVSPISVRSQHAMLSHVPLHAGSVGGNKTERRLCERRRMREVHYFRRAGVCIFKLKQEARQRGGKGHICIKSIFWFVDFFKRTFFGDDFSQDTHVEDL